MRILNSVFIAESDLPPQPDAAFKKRVASYPDLSYDFNNGFSVKLTFIKGVAIWSR